MNSSNKFVCIHGHFYQPPRENAWLEEIELQDSAAPFHDWNERINFECYAPNTAARILGKNQVIHKIVNNYSRISFNFGPTLLSWMEKADPHTYQSILNADKISLAKFSGHGSAIAQAHGHLILPLANRRDKETQIRWGMDDFKYRFGRESEGIWLAETAVDTETLEVLAEQGIKYTILAPRQAKAIRQIGSSKWTPVTTYGYDTRIPYLCKLPSGRTISLFFYDGNIAQGVAFDGLLNNGSAYAGRLLEAFSDDDKPQLVHVATDGESYGHHHRFGEMALAACINHIEEKSFASISNYGEFLEKFPPEFECQIHENSSWSCVHGVERWRSNCGCNSGGGRGWTQEWRQPLREGLDWLRDQIIPIYEKEASKLLKDPWEARSDYISILLNRNNAIVDQFLKKHSIKKLTKAQKTQALRLLEMQRNAMLMFTSCGWFFDEISGIETNQILQYALRAIAYAKQVGNKDFHPQFIKKLEATPSNVYKSGAESYQKYVLPSQVDLNRVGMHFAASSLFEDHPEELSIFNYDAYTENINRIEAGIQKLTLGQTTVKSKITHSEKHFSFAVLYLGQQNIIGNISTEMKNGQFDKMKAEIEAAFNSTNLGEVIGVMQQHFGEEKYTIWHLFRDEKRKILKEITEKNFTKIKDSFRDIYNDNYQLMTGMRKSKIPIPETFKLAAQQVINKDIHQFFEKAILDTNELRRLAKEIKKWDISIQNLPSFKLAASERIFYEIKSLDLAEMSLKQLNLLNDIFEIINGMDIELDIWKGQNLYYNTLKGYQNGEWVFASKEWKEAFLELGDNLKIKTN